MASVDGTRAALLASQSTTPIAQLNPDLPDQASRVVRGQVGITWPYNSVTKIAAFLLAEPDVRLRRDKGQVRIELHGPSAKAASECGIGAGDELLFSLDGVEWAKDVSPGRIPGSRVDWQLQFNERLVLQVKSDDSGEIKHIDINHPAAEQPPEIVNEARTATTPEPEPSTPAIHSAVRKISDFPANEYPSPAFVKRARISYGALFEGGFDIFEEDGGVMGKGRKRTRFGRDSGAWRYTSQSPSPGPTSPVQDRMEEDVSEPAMPQPSPTPQMADEGSQTVEVDMAQASPKPADTTIPQGETTPVPAEIPAPVLREPSAAPAQEEQVSIHQLEVASTTSATEEKTVSVDEREQSPARRAESDSVAPTTPEGQLPEHQRAEAGLPSTPQTKNAEPFPSTLFGTPKTIGSGFSMFGATAPARAESALSLSDQVRFGFSHIPQTTQSPVGPPNEAEPAPSHSNHEAYPVSYLDEPSDPAKYAEMNTSLDAADEQEELSAQGVSGAPEPPVVEDLGHSRWEMAAQSSHYNQIEGGHFGADALDEGTPITSGASPHTNNVTSENVPEGFASYGREDVSDRSPGSPQHPGIPSNAQSLVDDETISEDEVGVDEAEEEDAEYDEYAYGERIEEGDYDQRNYDIPSDDEEGLSEEDDEIELEAEERYGNGEAYDEDGEEWDEEEEEYDESEEDDEEEDGHIPGYQPRKPPAPAASKEPVVISLLSDSEDDDEPAPTPSKPPAAPRVAPAQDQSKPAFSEGAATARKGSPDGAKTEQTASTGPEVESHPPRDLFSQTHVVDFAARFSASNVGQPKVTATEMYASTVSTSSVSDAPDPLRVSNTQDDSRAPQHEPAPSETSSEGLFVKQPRTQDADAGDERIEHGSSGESKGADEEFTDEEEELEGQDEIGSDDEQPSVEASVEASVEEIEEDGIGEDEIEEDEVEIEEEEIEIEEDEPEEDKDVSFQFSKPPDSDDDLPDAEDSSFASQVEIIEMMEEDNDGPPRLSKTQGSDDDLPDAEGSSFASQVEMIEIEEASDGEDEDMGEADIPPMGQDTVGTMESELEVEEMETPDRDIDMIDAASVLMETASSTSEAFQSLRSEAMTDAPEASVVTETVSEVVITASAAGESLPSPQPTPQEERTPTTAASDGKLAATGPVQETAKDAPSGGLESALDVSMTSSPSQLADDMKSQAEQMDHLDESTSLEQTLGAKSNTDSLEQPTQKQLQEPQEPSTQSVAEDVGTPPAEPQRDTDASIASGKAVSDIQGVGLPEMAAAPDAQVDSIVPDSNNTSQQPAVVDEAVSNHEVSPSQVEQGELEQDDETKASTQQTEEPEATQQSSLAANDDDDDEAMIQAQLSQEQLQEPREAATTPSQSQTRSSSPDLSVNLARQAVAAKRSKKTAEPTRTSPRITRARSSSLQTNATPERDEQDSSVALARAALASPSKRGVEATTSTTDGNPATNTTTAALKADFTKRLRTELPECVPLKTLRMHLEKWPNTLAVVTTTPSPPARAKGGPREYFMSFHVTDPSVGPSQVVEVQLYRPHKDTLPVVKPGDVVLLQHFQVVALSKRGFGLRTGTESAWAVWDALRSGDDGENGGEEGEAPQIRGMPVEGWKECVGCVGVLRTWFVGLDAAARGRIEKADRKLVEAAGGGKVMVGGG